MKFLNWLKRKAKQPVWMIQEAKLIAAFLINGSKHVDELTKWMWERPEPFPRPVGYSITGCGLIRICDDIFGYEVVIGKPGNPMIDCSPSFYGVTSEQGHALFEAIISNLPGSSNYEAKFVKQGADTLDHLRSTLT